MTISRRRFMRRRSSFCGPWRWPAARCVPARAVRCRGHDAHRSDPVTMGLCVCTMRRPDLAQVAAHVQVHVMHGPAHTPGVARSSMAGELLAPPQRGQHTAVPAYLTGTDARPARASSTPGPGLPVAAELERYARTSRVQIDPVKAPITATAATMMPKCTIIEPKRRGSRTRRNTAAALRPVIPARGTTAPLEQVSSSVQPATNIVSSG